MQLLPLLVSFALFFFFGIISLTDITGSAVALANAKPALVKSVAYTKIGRKINRGTTKKKKQPIDEPPTENVKISSKKEVEPEHEAHDSDKKESSETLNTVMNTVLTALITPEKDSEELSDETSSNNEDVVGGEPAAAEAAQSVNEEENPDEE